MLLLRRREATAGRAFAIPQRTRLSFVLIHDVAVCPSTTARRRRPVRPPSTQVLDFPPPIRAVSPQKTGGALRCGCLMKARCDAVHG
jgi:hypothetical protein